MNKLKYDGMIIEQISSNEILKRKFELSIKKLEEKFSIDPVHCKEIMYRALEFAYKKRMDNVIITNGRTPISRLESTKDFLIYLKSIKRYLNITEEVTIKYKKAYEEKPGKRKRLKKSGEIKGSLATTIHLKGTDLLILFESIIRNSEYEEEIKIMAKASEQNPETFGNEYNTKRQTNTQYAKAALKEIDGYLNKANCIKNTKYITSAVLIDVGLANSYTSYINKMKSLNRKPESIKTHWSRIYASLKRDN